MYDSTKMTDPTIELAEDSSVKMLRVADLEVREVLVPIQEADRRGVGRRIQQVVYIRQN